MNLNKIFVIVVIYNGMRNDWIQKCFNSIINSTIPSQIVAIDNNSSDESVEYIKKNYPNVHLIINYENKGFGGANNQGLKYALENGGDYFFLLNQDAWVDSDTIEQLLNKSIENPEFGIISPMHLNGKGDALDFNFSNYVAPNNCKKLYSDFVLDKTEDKIYESDFICAAAWFLTKTCIEIVGGFSPTFFHYGEDDNYVHRLIFKKLKIGVYPKVFIYHDREKRGNNKFFQKDLIKERALLLKYSNPNIENNFKREKQAFTNKIIKNMILIDIKEVKRIYKDRQKFISIYEHTNDNLKKSKSTYKYIFINE